VPHFIIDNASTKLSACCNKCRHIFQSNAIAIARRPIRAVISCDHQKVLLFLDHNNIGAIAATWQIIPLESLISAQIGLQESVLTRSIEIIESPK